MGKNLVLYWNCWNCHIGNAGLVILVILYFVTRFLTPITDGRPLSINNIGMITEIFQFIFIGITIYILARQKGKAFEQKEHWNN